MSIWRRFVSWVDRRTTPEPTIDELALDAIMRIRGRLEEALRAQNRQRARLLGVVVTVALYPDTAHTPEFRSSTIALLDEISPNWRTWAGE